MSSIRVRNLDERVVSELKDRAKRHGNTLETELRGLLTEEAFRPRRETAERAQQLRDAIRAEVGTLSDSTPYIREWRDSLWTIVVDASVAVKWFIPEPGEAAAQELLGGSEPLFAPALIQLEVANATLRRFHEGQIQEGKAHAILAAWESLLANDIVRLVDLDAELFHVAVALSFICGHSLADCFYLAAAKSLDATFVTADARLRDRGTQAYAKITLLAGSNPN